MADNFNLRSFLSENKLTKNAQLLNENTSGNQISKLGYEALGQSTDPGIQKLLADLKASTSRDYDECDKSPECRNMMAQSSNFNPQSNRSQAIEAQLIKLAAEKGIDVKQQAPPATPEEEAKALGFWDKVKSKVGLKEENLDEAQFSDSYDTPAAKAVNAKANQIVNTITGYKTALQTIQDAIKQVEQEVGSEATRSEKSTLERHLMHIFRSNAEMERESVGIDDEEQANDIEQAQHDMERRIDAQVEGALQESRLTAKERRLVEMVNNAMGIQEEEIPNPHPENPDHEFGTNPLTGEPLPDPKSQMVVEDEMADETVIPEYNTIDELMNSIDHGTNKVAEEHKMQEMKKIAEALRMKAKKMEESEHAAHISPKDLKQLATDAAKLEKAAEKLKAAFDKKFNKKEKPAAAPKAEKVEALQEGNFDLRKFLIENKLTRDSQIIN